MKAHPDYTGDGPPVLDDGPDEPDLHDVGPTPLDQLGVPDPETVTEDAWLEAHQ